MTKLSDPSHLPTFMQALPFIQINFFLLEYRWIFIHKKKKGTIECYKSIVDGANKTAAIIWE